MNTPNWFKKAFEEPNENRIVVHQTGDYQNYFYARTVDDLKNFAEYIFDYVDRMDLVFEPVEPKPPVIDKDQISNLPDPLDTIVEEMWKDYAQRNRYYKEKLLLFKLWRDRAKYPITTLFHLRSCGLVNFNFEELHGE